MEAGEGHPRIFAATIAGLSSLFQQAETPLHLCFAALSDL